MQIHQHDNSMTLVREKQQHCQNKEKKNNCSPVKCSALNCLEVGEDWQVRHVFRPGLDTEDVWKGRHCVLTALTRMHEKKKEINSHNTNTPVISRTVLKIFSFSGSRAGTPLYSSLWTEIKSDKKIKVYCKKHRRKCLLTYWILQKSLMIIKTNDNYYNKEYCYPLIPVTRKWRLPWILVQFIKLSILRASTVCWVWVPVPTQAERSMKKKRRLEVIKWKCK